MKVLVEEKDQNRIKQRLEENKKKYPGPSKVLTFFCNFWKCIGYIFLTFYLFMIIKYASGIFNKSIPVGVFFILAFFPIFLSYEILFIILTVIGTIPTLVYPPLFRKLRFFIVNRLYQCPCE